jgi:hypothetical protein
MIADAGRRFARPGGRELQEREKRTPRIPGHAPGIGDLAEKDRPIDPMSGIEFARKRARTGFEPLE